jgi:Tetracyclin repressor-like, C-terminal domain
MAARRIVAATLAAATWAQEWRRPDHGSSRSWRSVSRPTATSSGSAFSCPRARAVQLRTFADEIVLPAVAGVALAMMNSSGSSLPAEVRDRFSATADTGLRAAVALAVAEGELTAPADPEDILALLSGPLIHRACIQGSTVSDALIDRVIDSIGTWHPRS